jgi:hypothetical protein
MLVLKLAKLSKMFSGFRLRNQADTSSLSSLHLSYRLLLAVGESVTCELASLPRAPPNSLPTFLQEYVSF